MRCREAKRRLDDGAVIDGDLRTHMESCDSCAQHSAAEMQLDNILAKTRNLPSLSATPFAEIRERVENKIAIERKGISLMSKVKHQIENHPKASFSLLAAVCAFVLMVLVPFSYNQTIGYTVAFEGIDPAYATPDNLLSQALTSLGLERATVDIIRDAAYADYKIGNLPSEESAREAAAAFNAVSGYSGPAKITPVVLRTSASLYAQVRDKLNKIEVDGKGKTDAEIKAEIENKLKAQGFANPQVTVETKADGMRQIDVGLTDSSETKIAKRQMEIAVGGDDISFDARHEISIDSEGKTDEEIREEVKKKLAEQGIQNPQITVTTDKDGKRNIEIKKEKKD